MNLFTAIYCKTRCSTQKTIQMKEKIGNNAGIVWVALEGQPAKSLKEVKKVTKLTEKDLYAALGWLAREEKVAFTEDADGEIMVAIA